MRLALSVFLSVVLLALLWWLVKSVLAVVGATVVVAFLGATAYALVILVRSSGGPE